MSQDAIPEDIRRFVLIHIPSIPYLEAMLLLRADPAGDWDDTRVAGALYMNERAAGALLVALLAAGMVARTRDEPPAYRYRPASDHLAATVDRLAQVYAAHLVEVTHLVHARTNKRAQRFADAFVWRKEG